MHAIAPLGEMAARHGVQGDYEADQPERANGRDRLPAMLADGRVWIGDRIYAAGHPTKLATIVSDKLVEYEGRWLAINAWGQAMTGWSSINIYASIYLERTGEPLGALRAQPDGEG